LQRSGREEAGLSGRGNFCAERVESVTAVSSA
jgi:hypothetical protein